MEGPTAPEEDTIDAKELARLVLDAALDKKATDPAILEVGDLVGYADYFVLVSGRSPRQVKAIADSVRQTFKKEHQMLPVGVEGQEGGQWVLVDFEDVVLHVFHEPTRGFYDLEGLWVDAPRLEVPSVPDPFLDDDDDDEDDDAPLFSLPS